MSDLSLYCPINQLGYGIASINILKALQAEEVNVSLHTIGQPQVSERENIDAVVRGLDAAKMFNPKAPCVKIWHQNKMAEFIGSGEHVGFPIFELNKFDNLEKHHLRSCDRLFVCSDWAKGIIEDQVPKIKSDKLNVIPLGVDTDIFAPANPRFNGKTIFFNCGKWEVRKGHDILIEAFKNVVKTYNNVELWMMCSNPFNSKEEERKWTQLYNHPNVKIIPRVETQKEVYNIITQVDCGVFPSRGEGWNLEILEMMATGKHVIATDYSAHTQFCTEDNCSLIPVNGLEIAFDGKWFFGQGEWGKVLTEDLERKMKGFLEMLSTGKDTLNEKGIETAKKFSWKNTAKEIIKCLKI